MLRNWPAVTQIENVRSRVKTPKSWFSSGLGHPPLPPPLVLRGEERVGLGQGHRQLDSWEPGSRGA